MGAENEKDTRPPIDMDDVKNEKSREFSEEKDS